MKVEPFLLVSTIKVIIAQRLVRRLSSSKEQYFMNKDELGQLAKTVDVDRVLQFLKEEKVVAENATWEKVPFYRAKPSKDSEDGYGGRVSIHEVLKMTSTIRDLVIKGASSDEIEAQAKKEKMTSMLEDGIFMAAQGFTTIEEVLRVVNSE
jgi:type IV pilus assembly protein PilB